MSPVTLRLEQVRILRTGADGGHLYIRGRTAFAPHGPVDAYAYFRDKIEERRFEAVYHVGLVEVTSPTWEYFPSTGLSLNEIDWKIIEPTGSS